MPRDRDARRIEVIDDASAEAMRGLGGTERLRMLNELTRACRDLMAAHVREQHADWTEVAVHAEVARRLRNAAA
jgi:hypothetical protein